MTEQAPSLPSALAIFYRPIEALVPYARNARVHSDEQVAQIAHSMVEYGWTNPVLTDGADGIIAGHGRVMAAKLVWAAEKDIRNCPKGQVPCIDLFGLSETQKRALILADNRIALNAGWDAGLLQLELKELKGLGVELPTLGFSGNEIAALLRRGRGADPDATSPLPKHPVSVPGDLWLLGKHRLLCGDCTVATDVAKALGDLAPHLMVTDPPYGESYDPTWRSKRLADGARRAEGSVDNDTRGDWTEAWGLFPGEVAYVWCGAFQQVDMARQLTACGLELRNLIVWGKERLVIGRGHYHSQHETCWYAVRKAKTGHWAGDRKQSNLWSIEHQVSDTGHATQKPVEAMRRPIENNSKAGDAVYEPFAGSGTTLIAAEMTDRACCAIEINPAYVDVALTRWQEFTGEQARHAESGASFADMALQRGRKQAK